jgi:hypothetical protein
MTPFLVTNAQSAMVVAPGGGYGFLAIDREGTDIAAWLNSIGVSAYVLKYRVPGRLWLPFGGAPLMDAQRAVGLIRQMAAEGKVAGLNASKIGFIGFSAGGYVQKFAAAPASRWQWGWVEPLFLLFSSFLAQLGTCSCTQRLLAFLHIRVATCAR